MNPDREIHIFPRALRDLGRLDLRYRRQIVDDLELLRRVPWPPGKVKRLAGTPLWEIKTGDFRSLFVTEGNRVAVARVVYRRDLDDAILRIEPRYVFEWIQTLR